ncbi:hypothetical protein [Rhodococcoides corynebacterioides]|uniref:DUF1499 domain-containing protein n=1 Tax=Rhodococcoides corynebacterioides TaxID=53972 RepID=A0ABS7P5C1_9NOCA|nr:hypothetical protein [Rhodococcus corynebacterioides]MBY6367211.1 hypothetical protein [Rhodococcus corynebacterioides]MBY6407375.1 hypothetical protein [Rhodococcus corynebacterioides]
MDCDPVTWSVRGSIDDVADRLAALARGRRPAIRDGVIELRLGSVALYRLLGVRLVASSFPIGVTARAGTDGTDGVTVTVHCRDPWTPYRTDRERRAYADRVAAVRAAVSEVSR